MSKKIDQSNISFEWRQPSEFIGPLPILIALGTIAISAAIFIIASSTTYIPKISKKFSITLSKYLNISENIIKITCIAISCFTPIILSVPLLIISMSKCIRIYNIRKKAYDLRKKAFYLYSQEKPFQTINKLKEVIKIEESLGEYYLAAKDCEITAAFYKNKKNIEKFLFYTEKAASLYCKFDKGYYYAGGAYKRMADIYWEQKEYKKAIHYFKLTISQYKKRAQDNYVLMQIADLNENIAQIYEKDIGNSEKCIFYLNEVVKKYLENEYSFSSAIEIYKKIAEIYEKKEDFANAIKYFNLAIKFCKKNKNSSFNQSIFYKIHEQIAKIFLKQEDVENAIKHFVLSNDIDFINLADIDQEKENACKIFTANLKIIEFYIANKNTKKELIFLEKSLKMIDKCSYLKNYFAEKTFQTLECLHKKCLDKDIIEEDAEESNI